MLMSKWKSLAIVALVIAGFSCDTSPQRYLDKGNGLFNAGRYAEAEINYQKAIQKDPTSGEAYYRYSLLKFKQGKLGESYRLVYRAAGYLPDREDITVALADTCFEMYLGNRGDANLYGQVDAISRRLLQKNPNSYDGLRLKGYVAML